MRKGKYTMTICIGFTALILTMVMFTQFKTVEETDITAIETMRETELRTELASIKSKYEEIDEKLTETENRINEYKTELANNADSSKLLEDEVKEAEDYLGYTSLKGEGVVVTLEDNEMKDIDYSDLLELVNELNIAGAEAISINEERIVSNTDISIVNYSFILVNSKKLSGPYIVRAIGDKKYLESAITIKGGFIDRLEADGKTIKYDLEDNIVLPAYDETLSFKQAKINEEKEETK